MFDHHPYPSQRTHRSPHAGDRPERIPAFVGSGRLPARWHTPPVQHADVVNLTDANFESEVGDETLPVLIDFWAETCVPCRTQEPTIEQLAQEVRGRIKVARCNVHENPKLLETFSVRAVPHLTVVQAGELLLELVGAHSLEQLRSHLRDVGLL